MAETEGYNGWTNYETWCVNLWLTNDQGIDEAARELVASQLGDGEHRRMVAENLKLFVEDLAEQTCPGAVEGASFVVDLFGHALAQVEWVEIVDGFAAGVAEVSR